MVLEFLLLGPVEVRQADRVLELPRKKQRALLALLALDAGRVVSTDRLADGLWGDDPPKGAKHALETYVSELRKTLGRETIETRPGGYLLAVQPDRVDALRLERLVAEARGEADAGDRADRLRTALALVRGAPLADLASEPFARTEAGRLAELELGAREELVDAELTLGRHADVVPVLEPLVAAHPYRERLRAQLMLALYRSGRQADALATFQEARTILVEELGIDPGMELQELHRAILRQDPELHAPQVAPSPTPPAPAGARPGRKTVTVLAAELANAADLADRLDPEPLRAVLDRYADLGRTAVGRHEGTWQPRGGAAILAIFGVPLTHEDDALRAVRAAVELREGVSALNDGLLPEHGVFLELRTAVATGEVLVEPESDDLATGRAVALAERLEREAQAGQILLGGDTYGLVRGVVVAEPHEDAGSGTHRLVELLPDVHGRTLRLDSPIVGRRRQLAALASAFESAVSDRTLHLFTILAPAGVGKSRLVEEFVGSLGELATVRRGRCLPYGEEAELWALKEAGLAEGSTDELDAVRARIESFARERPLVVVLDDLQWADPSLLALVDELAESTREAPVVLVCCARPELLELRPSWGGGKPNATSILLEPLSDAESERLLDNLLGESDVPGPVRDHIVQTSEGNPLFVEELLALLVERDVLRREAGRWTTTDLPRIPLPPTVQALVAARIDRLPHDERAVLELASIEGKLFIRDVLAALAAEDVDDALAALIRKELVRPTTDEPGRFTFRHQLIRDAAYSSIPLHVRAELHERLARLLESSQPELASHHLIQAERRRADLGGRGGSRTPGPRAPSS